MKILSPALGSSLIALGVSPVRLGVSVKHPGQVQREAESVLEPSRGRLVREIARRAQRDGLRLFVRTALLVVSALVGSAQAQTQAWKPAPGPLFTRWAKDVTPDRVHPEYPRPQLVRQQWLNLNGLWEMAFAKPSDVVPVGKRLPERILVPFPVESALSGVMKPAERVWYRRMFHLPDAWRQGRVLLHFQAVDWETTVYVNGRELGTHRGGYDAFSFDITDALQDGPEQELIVKVYDPTNQGSQPRGKQVLKPGGIWYTASTGIWQTVWMEPVPAAHIAAIVLVPDVDQSCLRLTVKGAGTSPRHTIHAVASDAGEEVGTVSGNVGSELRLPIPKAKLRLWSPSQPHLYDLRLALKDGERIVDEATSYFGMRKIDLAKDERGFVRMRLNGEFLFQIGPLDQGFWPDGLYTAPTDEALRYDIEAARRLGFNMARKHVKIEPLRWYYWCDRLGYLVWQDMPSADNKTPEAKKQFELELTRMVEGLRNHPSIVMWIVFNEGWGQHDTERYVEHVKRLDPSRLVNNASGWTDKQVGDVHDIHAYPGPAAPEPSANRASVLGEFGGLGLGVDGHTWAKKTWGYRGMANAQELTSRYCTLLRNVWALSHSRGLSAAVYTQITDVETECNGLLTYDRAVIKIDLVRAAAANQGRVPRVHVVLPTSQAEGFSWRYTFQNPGEGWFRPDFDDSSWQEGPAGFGMPKTPGAVVRTQWNTKDIWLRRSFQLAGVGGGQLWLSVHHDEDVEIYINGVLAASATGFTTSYEELPLTPQGRAALRPGRNVMAVHCKQTVGGQYIDVGIIRLAEAGQPQ